MAVFMYQNTADGVLILQCSRIILNWTSVHYSSENVINLSNPFC